jgi:hypothetical protein
MTLRSRVQILSLMLGKRKEAKTTEWSWLFPGSIVVEYVTHNCKIKGFNPTPLTRSKKMAKCDVGIGVGSGQVAQW